MIFEISLLDWPVVKAADLCLALSLALDVPFLWTRLTLFLLGPRLANVGARYVTTGAGSAGGRYLPCAIACSAFVASLFPVELVAMNDFEGEFKGKILTDKFM